MKTKHLIIYQFMAIILFIGCKKEFDVPPLKTLETISKINIAQIKAKYTNINYKFKSDSSLYCVIIADEVSGNLYKDIYVRDATGALHVKLIASGGLFIGDSIRINLQNCILNAYSNLIQLDSVDTEKSIVKLASGLNPQPIITSIRQILANTAATNSVQSKLVKLEDVAFINGDMNAPFADVNGKVAVNRVIKSCDGKTLTVRTSGYASFAGKKTPVGSGTFIGIVSQFGNTMQMSLRNLNDLNMNGSLCNNTPTSSNVIFLSKDFNDNSIGSGGWTSYTVTNSAVKWSASSFSGTAAYSYFAKISGYVSGSNSNSETWLISPSIDISQANNPILNFETAAAKFSGPPLDILVSTNYINGQPSGATWTSIASNCILSPTTTSYVWTESGDVALSNFKFNNFRVAFKYTSTTSGACTYELDNIFVKER